LQSTTRLAGERDRLSEKIARPASALVTRACFGRHTGVDRELTDERSLVARLKRGEASAFDAVYDRYRPRLFGFLVRLCGRRELGEDLLQETWLRLARHARRLDDDTRLGAWLFTVARNLYRSHRRWRLLAFDGSWRRGWSPETVEHTSPFDLASAGELNRRLERALVSLPVAHREVLLLVAVEHLEPSEAAAVLGVRPEAMRQRLSRARAALAQQLELDLERPSRQDRGVMHEA
jgi:RNA polymerase sigma factor (sigma-70 family)